MDAVTYPDSTVAGVLNDYFVPVKLNIEEVSQLADQYGAIWTPNINIVVGSRERAVYNVEGWLAPSEFVAMLSLARGHYHFSGKKFEEAGEVFSRVAENHPRSDFAAEANYYLGVCRYLTTQEVDGIKSVWGRLQNLYPQSTWAMRADIF